MYINRIILQAVPPFTELDFVLRDDFFNKPLHNVLLTGVNGSGKTTVLRVIAALWERFAVWLQNPVATGKDLIPAVEGLAAIEIHELLGQSVWLFIANSQSHWEALQQIAPAGANLIGEIRMGTGSGQRGRPTFSQQYDKAWLQALNQRREQLQTGYIRNPEPLPNIVLLDVQARYIAPLTSKGSRDTFVESDYQWLVTYEASERWQNSLEGRLRNLKARSEERYQRVIDNINQFLPPQKRLIGFDNSLRLRIQIGQSDDQSHYIDRLSSGEQASAIIIFMAERWLAEGGILLVDEPDLYLHVSMQQQLIHKLEKLIRQCGGQMIVTSHSPELWNEYLSYEQKDFTNSFSLVQPQEVK